MNKLQANSLSLFSVNVHMPKDRVTQAHQGYGFVEFMGEEDADYAIRIMNMIKMYGKPIRVNKVRISNSYTMVCIPYEEKNPRTVVQSTLVISKSNDPLIHFEISVLRHFRCAKLRKVPIEQPNFTNEHVI